MADILKNWKPVIDKMYPALSHCIRQRLRGSACEVFGVAVAPRTSENE
jgi:hypothetical protein